MNYLTNYQSDFWSNPESWQAIVSFLGVIGTLFLAYIAIFGKERFRKLKFTYEVSKIDQKININDEVTPQIFSIKIKNLSKRAARGVLVTVSEIRDKKNSKYFKRKDFIHMPLEWTHQPLERKVRNIAAGEEVYVDIGKYNLLDPGLRLFTNPRTYAKQLYEIMNNAKIILRLTEEHGFTEEIILDFKMLVSGAGIEIRNRKVLNRG